MSTHKIDINKAKNKRSALKDLSKLEQDEIIKYVMTHMEDEEAFVYLMGRYNVTHTGIVSLLIRKGYL